MSLISLYTSYFDKYGIEYDIIYIDKYNEEEYTTAKRVYRYPIKINREWKKIWKILVYSKFKSFSQKIINENEYDYIIVWRTETAIMFADYLSKRYKGRYCLNIRDYCMEKNPFVYLRVRKAVLNADFTTISSDGYRCFLPENDYLTIHSFNEVLLSKCESKTTIKKYGEPINVCFIGYVRFFNIDKKLIDALGNDSRYLIQFFGEGSQYLEEYAKEKKIWNVEFVKGFKIEETCELLKRADVINNLYGYNNIALDTAISTKYYYALYMNVPILVFKGTFMEEISCKSGVGYAFDCNFDSLADDFYDWYHSLNFVKLKEQCDYEIDCIKESNKTFEKLLEITFNNKNEED